MSSHRVVETWHGERIQTLADLLRPELRAVCIGINPSPVSVRAGHYYQGRLGTRFWQRLRQVGLLRQPWRYEDDTAFAEGIGFTDIVKKPTASAKELTACDFEHGGEILRAKLNEHRSELLIFTFKKAATELCGPFDGFGFTGVAVEGIEAFVMPGPYERADGVAAALAELRQRLN